MNITVNGKPLQLEQVATISDLVSFLGYQGKRIAIEANGNIVPKSQHDIAPVTEGDQIEIVVAVGGG